MKKILLCLCGIMMLISLCSCSNKITEGEVYKKEYREEHTSVMMLPVVISNGTTTTTTMMPYIIYYPDRYVVFIKSYQDGEWVSEDFYVSKEVYDFVNLGDMFSYDKGRGDMKDEPYTKERKET